MSVVELAVPHLVDILKPVAGVNVSPLPRAQVVIASPSLAGNAAVVAYLTNLINVSYNAEEGMFMVGGSFSRVEEADVRQYMRDGELAVAWKSSSDPARGADADVIGCVRLRMLDATTGELGMLMCDPACRGTGVGRDLVRFAESWARRKGAEVMQLELLMPEGWEHHGKALRSQWYERIGYNQVRTAEVDEFAPRLLSILVRPSRFRVYYKAL